MVNTSQNPDFISTAALLKNFLAYISRTYATLQKFFRALHLSEL